MSDIRITERCSCAASIEVVAGRYRNDRDHRNPRGAEEIVERWRNDHTHEIREATDAD